jgi:hypothetical protein
MFPACLFARQLCESKPGWLDSRSGRLQIRPKVIGTITFDSTYNIKTAKTDLTERDFTNSENDLYQIRKIALDELSTNSD